MNIEGAYVYGTNYKGFDFETETFNKQKLYSATIPFSLETYRVADKEFYFKDGKQHTDLFINVTFKKDYFVIVNGNKEIIADKATIREYIYVNGLDVDGSHYVFYKRGSNKAKTGSDIFVKSKYYDKFIDRSRLGLKFDRNLIDAEGNIVEELVDKTSLHAYEALVLSGLDSIIHLDKSEILIIDDIFGKEFNSIASVTEVIDGKVVTNIKGDKEDNQFILQNCLTDGQGLLSDALFEKYDKSDKSFMLLRSDFMKCCAFNTNLQEWFEKNEVTEIEEKLFGMSTGRVLKTDKLKLVLTPNSLKYLKFAYKFANDTNTATLQEFGKLSDADKVKTQIKCWRYWLDNIDDIFGVVKYDKEGNFKNYNRMTYQLCNSLPLSDKDVQSLAKMEIDYIMSMKNDNTIFRNHIGQNIKDMLELYEDIEDINYINNHYFNSCFEDLKYKTKDMISAMASINSNFQGTEKFKNWKKVQIENYEKNIRKGKFRLKDTKYVTLFSNPYEMLLATIGKYNNESIMKGREIWCTYYEENQKFCISRNPHVNSGNVMWAINKFHDEYKWFNLSDNICIINFFDNDAPDRLQGCDTDSDQIILFPTLYDKAKYCEDNFPTPINRIKGVSKFLPNNNKVLAALDDKLSNNYIGKIINKAQIINSYMWEAIENKADKKLIDKYYELSSCLSSLSQVEIDKSKKSFDNVSVAKELRNINSTMFEDKNIFEFQYVKIVNGKEEIIDKAEFEQIEKNNKQTKIINTYNDMIKLVNQMQGRVNDIIIPAKNGRKKSDEEKEVNKLNKLIEKYITKSAELKAYIDTNGLTSSDIIQTYKYLIVPRFFEKIAEKKYNSYRRFRYFKTPMDYLQKVLDKNIGRPEQTPVIDFKTLMIKQKDLNSKDVHNSKQVIAIYKIVEKYGKRLKGVDLNKVLPKKSKEAIKSSLKKKAVKELKDLEINSKTIHLILRIAFNISKHKTCNFNKYSLLTLNLLYNSHMVNTINCFVSTDSQEVLKLDTKGDIELFGEKYKKVCLDCITTQQGSFWTVSE